MSRLDKITEAIRKEVSIIIHDELKDPRLGFVTVVSVEVTKDLRYAKVFFSVLGSDEDYKKTKEALDSASGFIRKLIGERIRMRFVPEFSFREDRSTEYSIEIEKALQEVHKLTEPAPSLGAGRKTRKGKRHEPKKSRSLHKKK